MCSSEEGFGIVLELAELREKLAVISEGAHLWTAKLVEVSEPHDPGWSNLCAEIWYSNPTYIDIPNDISFQFPAFPAGFLEGEEGTRICLDPNLMVAVRKGLYFDGAQLVDDWGLDFNVFWPPIRNVLNGGRRHDGHDRTLSNRAEPVKLTSSQWKQIDRAVFLAERFATTEHRLRAFESLKMPERLLELEHERLSELKRELGESPLAQMFVPQAHKNIAMRAARHRYFDSTLLGKLEDSLTNELAHWGKMSQPDAGLHEDPWDFLSDEESLAFFINTTIQTGDAGKILDHLQSLLCLAKADIERRTDVPPMPPEYRLSDGAAVNYFLPHVVEERDDR